MVNGAYRLNQRGVGSFGLMLVAYAFLLRPTSPDNVSGIGPCLGVLVGHDRY